jgi:hypothetical protein
LKSGLIDPDRTYNLVMQLKSLKENPGGRSKVDSFIKRLG